MVKRGGKTIVDWKRKRSRPPSNSLELTTEPSGSETAG
jgi:hypothetical protein